MKASLILSAAFLFFSAVSFGQTVNRTDNKVEVKKGYYSIGNNSEKIAVSTPIPSDQVITPVVNKGYYAIERKSNKMRKRSARINPSGARPTVTKGYYAIGNNAQRL